MPPLPKELTLSRKYAAPRSLLWKIWSDPHHIKQWWGPFGPANTTCDIDFRVGGQFNIAMRTPEGDMLYAVGEYLEIKRPERIVYLGDADTVTACGCGAPPKAKVTVTFDEFAKDKTNLTVHTLFDRPEDMIAANEEGYTSGWTKTLIELEETLQLLEA
ncbi:SRPBCC domain-containing protein [Hyphococcus formosus]|uniref:SRPBCC family protein n=1 Tax=Hyphococcus formosus TaxID=3143534 RepID=UPI00398B5D93